MDATGIVLDVDNPDVGLRHFIKVGPQVTDITTFASPMTIEPDTINRRVFAVSVARRLEMYVDFGVYVDRVNALLNTTSTMTTLTARGSFDEDSTTLTANFVAITFTAP